MSFDQEAVQSASAALPDEHLQSAPAGSGSTATATQATPDPAAQTAASAPAQTPPAGDQQPQDPAAQPQEPPRKKGGLQTRIDELTRERYEAQRRAAALEQELQRVQTGQQQAPQEKPAPKIEDYQDVNSFLEARDAWVLDKARTELRMENEQAAQRQRMEAGQSQAQLAQIQAVERFTAQEAEVRERHADYDEAVQNPLMLELRDRRPDVAQAVIDSPHGPEVAYFLAKNPQAALAIARLPTLAAAREIGRIEQMFMQPRNQTTNAPAPPRQVGGKAEVSKDPEKMSMAEYRQWRKSGGRS